MTDLTLTLTDLAAAAAFAGHPAEVTNTGGGVMALAVTFDGVPALLALDYGQEEGSTWSASLDAEARERHGEEDTGELPVTSDAEQTIADARAWVRHTVYGR